LIEGSGAEIFCFLKNRKKRSISIEAAISTC
jgi:hypothetical protein